MTLPTIGWFCETAGGSLPALSLDQPLTAISIDSRTLQAGDTFWAIKSTRDGHDFVSDAFSRGAKAAVVNLAWLRSGAAATFHDRLIGVADTMRALTLAAEAWRRTLFFPMIGITGTNGKTSTKDLLLQILSTKLKAIGTPGNFNNELGVPLTLLAIPQDSDVAVMEMGASHPGEIADLCQICKPTHGLVTSISLAHLAGFATLREVARTKGALYDYVAETGVAFVPTDDALCREVSALNRDKVGYGFGEKPLDWNGEHHHGMNLTFDTAACAHFEFHETSIVLAAPGRPAAVSALAALSVAQNFGIDAEESRKAIRKWQGVGGRATIQQLGMITVMDDSYNANPTSMRAALETLSFLPGKRHVAILGDMNELGSDAEKEHRTLGHDLKQFGSSAGIFIGEFAPVAAAEAEAQGVEARAFLNYEECEAELPSLIRDGDAVLVKGSRSMRLERAVQMLKSLYS